MTITAEQCPDNKLYVIMGNDFPCGVVNTEHDAKRICDEFMARQKAQALTSPGQYKPRIYYRYYDFALNNVEP